MAATVAAERNMYETAKMAAAAAAAAYAPTPVAPLVSPISTIDMTPTTPCDEMPQPAAAPHIPAAAAVVPVIIS